LENLSCCSSSIILIVCFRLIISFVSWCNSCLSTYSKPVCGSIDLFFIITHLLSLSISDTSKISLLVPFVILIIMCLLIILFFLINILLQSSFFLGNLNSNSHVFLDQINIIFIKFWFFSSVFVLSFLLLTIFLFDCLLFLLKFLHSFFIIDNESILMSTN